MSALKITITCAHRGMLELNHETQGLWFVVGYKDNISPIVLEKLKKHKLASTMLVRTKYAAYLHIGLGNLELAKSCSLEEITFGYQEPRCDTPRLVQEAYRLPEFPLGHGKDKPAHTAWVGCDYQHPHHMAELGGIEPTEDRVVEDTLTWGRRFLEALKTGKTPA